MKSTDVLLDELQRVEQMVETLQRERDEARDALARLAKAGTGYSQQTLDAVSHERDHLRDMLREVEWAECGDCSRCKTCRGWNAKCPICFGCNKCGHAPDCGLAAALQTGGTDD